MIIAGLLVIIVVLLGGGGILRGIALIIFLIILIPGLIYDLSRDISSLIVFGGVFGIGILVLGLLALSEIWQRRTEQPRSTVPPPPFPPFQGFAPSEQQTLAKDAGPLLLKESVEIAWGVFRHPRGFYLVADRGESGQYEMVRWFRTIEEARYSAYALRVGMVDSKASRDRLKRTKRAAEPPLSWSARVERRRKRAALPKVKPPKDTISSEARRQSSSLSWSERAARRRERDKATAANIRTASKRATRELSIE